MIARSPVPGLLLALALAGCITAAADPEAPTVSSDQKVKDAIATYTEQLIAIGAESQKRIAKRDAEQRALCAKKGGVGVGMSKAQVLASCWGKPEKVNVTTSGGGEHEQWVYPGFQYVYLRNGVVTSIQSSR